MKEEDYNVALPAVDDDLTSTKKRRKYSKFILFSALFALFLLLGGASAGVTIYLINNDLIGGSENLSTSSPSRNGTENTSSPSLTPTSKHTNLPSRTPSKSPSSPPSKSPSNPPSSKFNGVIPTKIPTSLNPTRFPSQSPVKSPTSSPSKTNSPTTRTPSRFPTISPTNTKSPSSRTPSRLPTTSPTNTKSPTSRSPSKLPISSPTSQPQPQQTSSPSILSDSTPSPLTTAPTPPFNIRIINITGMTLEEEAGFVLAKQKWESILTAGYPTSITIAAGTNPCGVGYNDRLVIEDLVIFAAIRYIDGSGGVLGQAGPCIIGANRVRAGVMIFDINDSQRLISLNRWRSTILHEMGHILGIGTRWDAWSLVDPNFNYLGVNGNIGNSEIGGIGSALVEDTGGSGTLGSHWRETVYQEEIMTGYLTGASQPISRLTIRSLADLGYSVNPELADFYEIPTQQRRLDDDEKKNNLRMVNDIYEGPIEVIPVSKLRVKPGREKEWNTELAKYLRRTTTPT